MHQINKNMAEGFRFNVFYVSKVLLFTIAALSLFPSYVRSTARYTSIYGFGDSWEDTGSSYYFYKVRNISSNSLKYPYGETYFKRPTGRFSDGRLVIDFIAMHLGLPLVKPYFGSKITQMRIQEGVNFAVAGATALDPSFFKERGIPFATNYTLRAQLDFFKNSLHCASPSSCTHSFRNSLFLVGEIGGVDYLLSAGAKKINAELTSYIPQVVNTIISAVEELLKHGAVTLLVPGAIPIGCNPTFLTLYENAEKQEYDQYGCLKWWNEFAEIHNRQLKDEINNLTKLYPHANIVYADYYNILLKLVRAPPKSDGFANGLVPIKCCCGGGGPYNWNLTVSCGSEGSTVCDEPWRYVYWDGAHLTDAAYGWIAKNLLSNEPFTKMYLSSIFDSSM